MEKEELEKRNLDIAKMLGWFQDENHRDTTWFELSEIAQYVVSSNGLTFHKDWDMLLKAFAFVEDKDFQTSVIHNGVGGYSVSIFMADTINFNVFIRREDVEWNNHNSTKKAAMFQAISDFAAWYNENKLN